MKLKNILYLSIFSLLLTACGTNTAIVGSYTSPEAAEKAYDNIMVTGLTRNILPREVVETQTVNALRRNDVEASHSMDLISEHMNFDDQQVKDSVINAVDERGFDAYLVVTLLDKETETTYVPGNTSYAPLPGYPHYQNYWGYYTHNYRVVYEPGYYTVDQLYYMEANLFDAETEELVWSAQTRSYDPGSIQALADDLARTIASELESQNLLGPENEDQLAED